MEIDVVLRFDKVVVYQMCKCAKPATFTPLTPLTHLGFLTDLTNNFSETFVNKQINTFINIVVSTTSTMAEVRIV